MAVAAVSTLVSTKTVVLSVVLIDLISAHRFVPPRVNEIEVDPLGTLGRGDTRGGPFRSCKE